jgi:hypothetical protein
MCRIGVELSAGDDVLIVSATPWSAYDEGRLRAYQWASSLSA